VKGQEIAAAAGSAGSSKGDEFFSSALCVVCCAQGQWAAALPLSLVANCLSTSRPLYLPVLPLLRLEWWSEN